MFTIVARQPKISMATIRTGLKSIRTDATPIFSKCGIKMFNDDASASNNAGNKADKNEVDILCAPDLHLADHEATKKGSPQTFIPTMQDMVKKLDGLICSSTNQENFKSRHLVDDLKNAQSVLQKHITFLTTIRKADESCKTDPLDKCDARCSSTETMKSTHETTSCGKFIRTNGMVVKKKLFVMARRKSNLLVNNKKATSSEHQKSKNKNVLNDGRKLFKFINFNMFAPNDSIRRMHFICYCNQNRFYHKRMEDRFKEMEECSGVRRDDETDTASDKSVTGKSSKDERNALKTVDEVGKDNEPVIDYTKGDNSDESLESAVGTTDSCYKRNYFVSGDFHVPTSSQSDHLLDGMLDNFAVPKPVPKLRMGRSRSTMLHINGLRRSSSSIWSITPSTGSTHKHLNPFKEDFKEYSTMNLKGSGSEIQRNRSDHLLHDILLNSFNNADTISQEKLQDIYNKSSCQTEIVGETIKGLMLNDYLNQSITECMNNTTNSNNTFNILKYNNLEPLCADDDLRNILNNPTTIKDIRETNDLLSMKNGDILSNLEPDKNKPLTNVQLVEKAAAPDDDFNKYLTKLERTNAEFLESFKNMFVPVEYKLTENVESKDKLKDVYTHQAKTDAYNNALSNVVEMKTEDHKINDINEKEIKACNDFMKQNKTHDFFTPKMQSNKSMFTEYIRNFSQNNDYALKDIPHAKDMLLTLKNEPKNTNKTWEERRNERNKKVYEKEYTNENKDDTSDEDVIGKLKDIYDNIPYPKNDSIKYKTIKNDIIKTEQKMDASLSANRQRNLENKFKNQFSSRNDSSVYDSPVAGFLRNNSKDSPERTQIKEHLRRIENKLADKQGNESRVSKQESANTENKNKFESIRNRLYMKYNMQDNLENRTNNPIKMNQAKGQTKKVSVEQLMTQHKGGHETSKQFDVMAFLDKKSKLKNLYSKKNNLANKGSVDGNTEAQDTLNYSSPVRAKISAFENKLQYGKLSSLNEKKLRYNATMFDDKKNETPKRSVYSVINSTKNNHTKNMESVKSKIANLQTENTMNEREKNDIQNDELGHTNMPNEREHFTDSPEVQEKFTAIKAKLASRNVNKYTMKRQEQNFYEYYDKINMTSTSEKVKIDEDLMLTKKKLQDLQIKIANHKNRLNDTKYSMENIEKDKFHYDFSIKIKPDERHVESTKKINMTKVMNNATEQFGKRRPDSKAQTKLFEKFHSKVKEMNDRIYDKRKNNANSFTAQNEKISLTHATNVGRETSGNIDMKQQIFNMKSNIDDHVKNINYGFSKQYPLVNDIKETSAQRNNTKKVEKQTDENHNSIKLDETVMKVRSTNQLTAKKAESVLSRMKSDQSVINRTSNINKARKHNGDPTKNLMNIFSNIKHKAYKFFTSKNLPDVTNSGSANVPKNPVMDSYLSNDVSKMEKKKPSNPSDFMKTDIPNKHKNKKYKIVYNNTNKYAKDDSLAMLSSKETHNIPLRTSKSNIWENTSMNNSDISNNVIPDVTLKRSPFHQRHHSGYMDNIATNRMNMNKGEPLKKHFHKEIKIEYNKLYNAANIKNVNTQGDQMKAQNFDYFLKKEKQFDKSNEHETYKRNFKDEEIKTNTPQYNMSTRAFKLYNLKNRSSKKMLEESSFYNKNMRSQFRTSTRSYGTAEWVKNSEDVPREEVNGKEQSTIEGTNKKHISGLIDYLQDRAQNNERLKTMKSQLKNQNLYQLQTPTKIGSEELEKPEDDTNSSVSTTPDINLK